MKPGLSDRLSRLKKAQKAVGKTTFLNTNKDTDLSRDSVPGSLKGNWYSPSPDLWVKKRICPSPLKNFKSSSLINAAYPDQSEWLFYDTETTGLSGGAGNIAFLVGIGRPLGDEFHIIQFFLKDYPAEPAMLDLLNEEIQKSSLFISYNGKSFDKPLLETRFLMNRQPCRMGDQLDLLYPVRSLFKNRIDNCRLATVEEKLLDIHRIDDVPGSEIPDIWFSFLKNGDHPDLSKVIEHNEMDIISLAVLLKKVEDFLINPDSLSCMNSFKDPCALGQFLLNRNDERGILYLEEAVKNSDPRGELILSLYLKRKNEWDKASALWNSILNKRLSPFAAVEMAKYLEHRKKDYQAALILIDQLLRDLPPRNPRHHKALVHRRTRLIQKIEKSFKTVSGSF